MKDKVFIIFLFILIIEPIVSQTDSASNRKMSIVREKNNRDTILPDTVIYSWKYLPGNLKIMTKVDTAPHSVLYHDPSRIGKYYQIGLGNLGQPVMNPNVFERMQTAFSNHWMLQYFDPYLQYHEKIDAFNTKTPFTRLYYTSSKRKWQTFYFIHTQNVNNNFNLGVLYNIYSSLGSYVYQSSRNRNGSFWVDVNVRKYQLFASANFNRLKNDFNGGVVDPTFVTDSVNYSIPEIKVKLSQTGSDIRFFDGKLQHQFLLIGQSFKNPISIKSGPSHEFRYSKIQRKYFDPQNTTFFDYQLNQMVNYFSSRYNKRNTHDTISVIRLANNYGWFVELGSQNEIVFQSFIKDQTDRYSNLFKDTLFTYINDTMVRSFWAEVRSSGTFFKKQLSYSFQGEMNLKSKYYRDNHRSTIHIFYSPEIKTKFHTGLLVKNYRITPDFLLQKFYSNHYRWTNRLPNEMGTSIRIYQNFDSLAFEINYNLQKIHHLYYFDQTRMRKTATSLVTVQGVEVSKKQQLNRWFEIYLRGLYQWSNDTIIDFPAFLGAGTVVFKTPVYFKSTHGRLNLQVGLDLWYNSPSYLNDFDPALNQFFTQRTTKLGGYFLYDMFINAKIKRIVIFARFDNINSLLSGRTHFDAYGYPARLFSTKFGFSWTFYD